MKIKRIRYLVAKPGAQGVKRYYWQPSARLRKAGWQLRRLSGDPQTAIINATEINRRLDIWARENDIMAGLKKRDSGGAPEALARPKARGPQYGTLDWAIERYRRGIKFRELRPQTRVSYESLMRGLSRWSGAVVVWGLRASDVQVMHDGIAAVSPHRARNLVKMLKIVLKEAIKEGLVEANAAIGIDVVSRKPRQSVWEEREVDAAMRAADIMGFHAVATAIMIARFLGQRQGDILRLKWDQYDGRVIRLRQRKTDKLVEVPVIPELAARLDALSRGGEHIIINENTRLPYTPCAFRRDFGKVREEAAKVCPGIRVRYFHDLRRTCVVRLAEADATEAQIAAVTGHDIERSRQILETYLPRSSKMAEAAMRKCVAHRAAVRSDHAASGVPLPAGGTPLTRVGLTSPQMQAANDL